MKHNLNTSNWHDYNLLMIWLVSYLLPCITQHTIGTVCREWWTLGVCASRWQCYPDHSRPKVQLLPALLLCAVLLHIHTTLFFFNAYKKRWENCFCATITAIKAPQWSHVNHSLTFPPSCLIKHSVLLRNKKHRLLKHTATQQVTDKATQNTAWDWNIGSWFAL